MAIFKSGDIITQAFRKNQQLQKFVLTGVIPTNRELGRGSYGSVEEVSKKPAKYRAKMVELPYSSFQAIKLGRLEGIIFQHYS